MAGYGLAPLIINLVQLPGALEDLRALGERGPSEFAGLRVAQLMENTTATMGKTLGG
jgi:hypothetical protein